MSKINKIVSFLIPLVVFISIDLHLSSWQLILLIVMNCIVYKNRELIQFLQTIFQLVFIKMMETKPLTGNTSVQTRIKHTKIVTN